MKSVGLLCIAMLFLCGTVYAERTVWYVHPDSALNMIQAGLDSCADNDIVLVGPGTYYQNIVWPNTQGIHLISELGPELTIIDTNAVGTVISIATVVDTSTVIRGFTIRNGITYFECACIDCIYGASPTICDNIVTNNGSYMQEGGCIGVHGVGIITRNRITGNVVSAPGAVIVAFEAIIDSNIIEYNGGIAIKGQPYSIRNNIITNNSCGINCWPSLPEYFSDNVISHNADWGMFYGLIVTDMFRAHIEPIRNKCIYNRYQGGGNVFSYNGGHGIVNDTFLDIQHEIITHSGVDGIHLNFGGGVIDSCTIAYNQGCGLYAEDSLYPTTIHYCNIYGNVSYGVYCGASDTVLDAENNWWGDASGPYHPTLNPGGLGDSVSDNVDFIPWLTDSVQGIGVEEQPISKPMEIHKTLVATIFRGPLQLPADKKCKVFDITGRVVEPSKIQPGIYFIEVDGVVTQKVVKVR